MRRFSWKVDFDGGITILPALADIGTSASTILTQTVAEVLGVDYACLRYRQRQRHHTQGQRLLFVPSDRVWVTRRWMRLKN